MAKVTITNLNTLLDGVVTGNIAVQTAQAAVTQSSTNASNAAASALSAASSKNEVDSQVLAAQAIANDISDDVVSNELIKDFITDLETAVRAMAESVKVDKDEAQDILDDVITKYSAVLVRYNMINALVTDFHTKYLGASLEAPNASWEGMKLATGMIYYDIAKNSLMIWVNTNKWVSIIEAINILLATNNLSDLLDKEAARVNLNVYSREETITLLEEQDEASEIAFDGTVSGLVAENVQSAVDEIIAQKAQPSGIASLDVNGHVPSAQLPSYVDDVIEVATYVDLPVIGEAGKIYIVVTDENSGNDTSSYRWTGTVYAMVSNTLTAADVKALYEANPDTNAYTDAEQVKVGYITVTQAVDLDTIESDTALNNTHRTSDGTDHTYIDQDVTTTATPTFAGLVTTGLVDGRDISVDGLKLDGIEAGATADQTASEIEVLYEGIADTNKYTDAEKTKLSNTEITTQLNDRDTANRDRANHTGTQSIDTVTETAGLKVMTSTERTVLDAATPLTTTATTLTTAINELDSGKVNTTDVILVTNGGTGATDAAGARTNLDVPQATEINAVLGTAVNKRYDKRLAALDIIDMEYTSGDLVTVRYEGDNDTNVFYRDVLAYVTGDLVTVKHYCNTADLVTESGLTTLAYDVDKNLVSSTYTEV